MEFYMSSCYYITCRCGEKSYNAHYDGNTHCFVCNECGYDINSNLSNADFDTIKWASMAPEIKDVLLHKLNQYEAEVDEQVLLHNFIENVNTDIIDCYYAYNLYQRLGLGVQLTDLQRAFIEAMPR